MVIAVMIPFSTTAYIKSVSSIIRCDSSTRIESFLTSSGDVVIGNDVWIGSDVIILSGITIGDGAVIGVGSVVTSDIPHYAVAGGNPARIIKTRFPDESIEKLLEIRWWDWPPEKINRHVEILLSGNVDRLLEVADKPD